MKVQHYNTVLLQHKAEGIRGSWGTIIIVIFSDASSGKIVVQLQE